MGMSNLSESHKAPSQAAQDTQVTGIEGGKVPLEPDTEALWRTRVLPMIN